MIHGVVSQEALCKTTVMLSVVGEASVFRTNESMFPDLYHISI